MHTHKILSHYVGVSPFLPPPLSPVFSLDYDDDLDLLVSGSADFSVKVWSLTAGSCLNTLTGHTEWVTKVSWTSCRWSWYHLDHLSLFSIRP